MLSFVTIILYYFILYFPYILILYHPQPLSCSSFTTRILYQPRLLSSLSFSYPYHPHPLSTSSFIILILYRPYRKNIFIICYSHLEFLSLLVTSLIMNNFSIQPHFYLNYPQPHHSYRAIILLIYILLVMTTTIWGDLS